ncbi:MAG: tetratricopeptide repeat protein [Acidobacteriota bacterium]
MKRCPECRRDYFDDTLLYCLDDGNALLEGPASADEAATAILSIPLPRSGDAELNELPTRQLSPSDGSNDNAGRPNFVSRIGRNKLALTAGIAIVLIFGGSLIYYFTRATRSSAKAIRSVMVLPLKNVGGDPQDEYLSDGITDELTSRLTQLKIVRVAAPSAALRYKTSTKDAAEIGREMNVEAVIEGTVRKQANKFRVTLHLINAADGFELWSDSDFEGDVGDLFSAQSRLAELMATRLKGELTSQEKTLIATRDTTNADAYEIFLKGKQQFRSGQSRVASELFDRAIQLDPNFADAYAWRGRVTYGQFKIGTGDHTTLAAALADANHALSIDPNLISARRTLIGIYHSTGQYEEGLKQGKLALDSDVDDLEAIEGAALAYFRAGMISKAIALYERGVALDPTDSDVRSSLARAYLYTGEFQKAIDVLAPALQRGDDVFWVAMLNYRGLRQLDKSIEMGKLGVDRNSEEGSLWLEYGSVLQEAGRSDDARQIWLKGAQIGETKLATFENVRTRVWLAFAYARLGERSKALEQINRAHTLEPDDAWTLYQCGSVHGILNDRSEAIDYIKRSIARGWLGVHYLNFDSDPLFSGALVNLRDDPEFRSIRSDLQKKVDELSQRY